MADKPLPSPEVLRQLLTYDPETGEMTWKERDVSLFNAGRQSAERACKQWNTMWAGRPAFTARNKKTGHQSGSIFASNFLKHRVAWAMHYGKWLDDMIDHINGDPGDNRILNLREAKQWQNKANAGKRKIDASSSYIGVVWCKKQRKWIGQIGHLGKCHRTKGFDGEIEAARHRDALAKSLKGEFARLNFEEAE